MGRGHLAQVRSLRVHALAHMLKIEAWPQSRDVPHWRAEGRGFRGDAADVFTPSMRRGIEVADLYARALQRLPDAVDGRPAQPVADVCPVTLDDLLSDAPLRAAAAAAAQPADASVLGGGTFG